jgi:hypothetical protein
MASKKMLASEVERLAALLRAQQAGERERAERVDQVFTEALQSVTTSPDGKVRVIMPNGTIVVALVADLSTDYTPIDVGNGQMIQGLRSVTITLHLEPGR